MKGLQVHSDNMHRNLELTQGLVFSQKVLIALIDKGLNRQKAYEMVQRNAMKAWKERTSFLNLLKKDGEVTNQLSNSEIEAIFDYNLFLKHVDEVFERLELTKRKERRIVKVGELAPKAL